MLTQRPVGRPLQPARQRRVVIADDVQLHGSVWLPAEAFDVEEDVGTENSAYIGLDAAGV